MIQKHKLRGKTIDSIGNNLMHGYTSWILEAAPDERSWLKPNVVGKGGVGILLYSKYVRLVTEHGALYDNRLVVQFGSSWKDSKEVKSALLAFMLRIYLRISVNCDTL